MELPKVMMQKRRISRVWRQEQRMEFEHLEFKTEKMTGNGDAQTLARAIGMVDPDAKVDVDVDAGIVKIDSWMMAEEFLVAFEDAGYKAKISKG